MIEHAERVIDGVVRISRALEIPAVVIGVEDNKPEAVESLNKAIAEKGVSDLVEVLVVPAKYPAGGEKSPDRGHDRPCRPHQRLAHRCRLPGAQRPPRFPASRSISATACRWFAAPSPLRAIALANPGNYRVPLGMSVGDVIEATGGLVKESRSSSADR